MKYYKYETHMHTSECSACAHASAEEQVAFYARMGYSGIIITDHFFNGNTTVPDDLSWGEKVERLGLGYENALEAGKKEGIDVFFGFEYSFRGTDFLVYGLSLEWLEKNPQIMELEHWDFCDYVRSLGALVIHAHPFSEAAGRIKEIRLLPRKVDGVEVFNANRSDFENKRALEYAKNYNLIKTAGSDNHIGFMQNKLAGIKTKEKIECIEDFIDIVKHGEFKIFTN
ncbi:MAG: PHP domain-containing protein [Clostridia bacterium]|nr:PHP domain-containing protein [Clostridia bacterium]